MEGVTFPCVRKKKQKKTLTIEAIQTFWQGVVSVGSPFSKSNDPHLTSPELMDPEKKPALSGKVNGGGFVQPFWARKCPVQPGDFFSMFQDVSTQPCCARSCHWDLPN